MEAYLGCEALEGALLCLALFLFHDHGVVVRASGDDHRCECVASVDTFIVHDVLGEVLSKILKTLVSGNI